MAIDPVCGMTVDPQTAKGSYEHEGETYYFCSKSCLERFRGNPAAYLNGGKAADVHQIQLHAPRPHSPRTPSACAGVRASDLHLSDAS